MMMVVMVVAVTVNPGNFMMAWGDILVVVMRVWFGSFSATRILIISSIFILWFSAFASCRVTSVLGRSIRAGIMWSPVRIFSSGQTRAIIRKLCPSGHGTRNSPDSAANPRKHTAKLRLNAWFAGGPGQLRLGALHCLGQWRYPTSPVDLLDLQ